MLQPIFRRPLLDELAGRARSNAKRLIDAWSEGDEIDVADAMMALAQRNILETLLGSASDHLFAELAAGAAAKRRFIEHLYFSLFPLPEFLPTRVNLDYLRRMRRVYAALEHEIDGRQRASDRPADMLSMLIDATGEDGRAMSNREVRDEVITFSLTGYETVGEALTWTLLLLAQHPRVDARLASEVRSNFDLERPAGEQLPELAYSRAVIRESMRLFPPTWIFGRVARAEDVLPSGASVTAGSKLYLCPYAVHRNARLWPDPARFDPNRFLEGAGRGSQRYAYLPFGGGPRQCIGESLATAEIVTVLATVVGRYRLTLPPGQEVVPAPGLTLGPRDGLRMRAELRSV